MRKVTLLRSVIRFRRCCGSMKTVPSPTAIKPSHLNTALRPRQRESASCMPCEHARITHACRLYSSVYPIHRPKKPGKALNKLMEWPMKASVSCVFGRDMRCPGTRKTRTGAVVSDVRAIHHIRRVSNYLLWLLLSLCQARLNDRTVCCATNLLFRSQPSVFA